MKKYLFLVIISSFLLPCAWPQNQIKALTIHENIINPVTADYIEKGLELTQSQEAILILKIDTPGGLLKSTDYIGAAHPVVGGGSWESLDEKIKKKNKACNLWI